MPTVVSLNRTRCATEAELIELSARLEQQAVIEVFAGRPHDDAIRCMTQRRTLARPEPYWLLLRLTPGDDYIRVGLAVNGISFDESDRTSGHWVIDGQLELRMLHPFWPDYSGPVRVLLGPTLTGCLGRLPSTNR